MITEIYFIIKASEKDNTEKNVEIEFMLEYNGAGECIDGLSYNLCTGWTNYNNWHQGWTEPDHKLEILYEVISEYSKTMECEQLVAEMAAGDLSKKNYVYDKEVYGLEIYCKELVTA